MKPWKIEFPVGPNRTIKGGVIRKASDPDTCIPVRLAREGKEHNQVQMPDGSWYELQEDDFFGPNLAHGKPSL